MLSQRCVRVKTTKLYFNSRHPQAQILIWNELPHIISAEGIPMSFIAYLGSHGDRILDIKIL